MPSDTKKIEALSSALELILPPRFLHHSCLVSDHSKALTANEKKTATSMQGVRLEEFSTSRKIVRELLKVLKPQYNTTIPDILPDKDGAANWPNDTCGSISHSKGVCSVVIATSLSPDDSIGIDIETLGRLSTAAKRRICSETEQHRVETYAKNNDRSIQDAYTLIFSAKEAFFKYQFPKTKLWLEFQDAEVCDFHKDSLVLRSKKCIPNLVHQQQEVFFAFTDTLVATATWDKVDTHGIDS